MTQVRRCPQIPPGSRSFPPHPQLSRRPPSLRLQGRRSSLRPVARRPAPQWSRRPLRLRLKGCRAPRPPRARCHPPCRRRSTRVPWTNDVGSGRHVNPSKLAVVTHVRRCPQIPPGSRSFRSRPLSPPRWRRRRPLTRTQLAQQRTVVYAGVVCSIRRPRPHALGRLVLAARRRQVTGLHRGPLRATLTCGPQTRSWPALPGRA